MKKAYLVSSNGTISSWLKKQYDIITVNDMKQADLVVFPGGLDVDPSLYGEPIGQRTSASKDTDAKWSAIYRNAVGQNKKLLGICKGSQFLTVMAGGRLYQHVTGHGIASTHSILVKNKKYFVTSTHHQMMNPSELDKEDYEVLAYSDERRSSVYLNGYDDEEKVPEFELETVFYKGNGALAIQFHPEYMEEDDPIQDVIKGWLHKLEDYKLKDLYDKYSPKKRFGSENKSQSSFGSTSVYTTLTHETFNEFIKQYL